VADLSAVAELLHRAYLKVLGITYVFEAGLGNGAVVGTYG
jgi:hypothetical protein